MDAARGKLAGGDLSKLRRPLTAEKIANVHYAEALELDQAERDFLLPTAQFDPDEIEPKWLADALASPREVDPIRARFRNGYAQALRRVASGRAPNDEMQAVIGWAVDKFTERRNTTVKPKNAEWRQLARSLAAVQLEALARADERDQGDWSGEPKLPVLRHDTPADVLPISGDKARILCAESKLPLSEIVLRMHAEKKNLRDGTKNEQRVAVRMFEEFLGEPTPIYKIARRDVIAYKTCC